MKCSNCGAGFPSPRGASPAICPYCVTDNSVKKQTAASEGRTALRKEFLRRGESLYKDKGVLGALVGDLFAGNQKLLRILRLAVQDNLALKIAELPSHSADEQKMRILSIVSCFAGDYDMSKARAAEAVRVLAFGAGVANEVLEWLVQTVGSSNQFADIPAESLRVTQIDAAPAMPMPPDPSIIGSIYPFGGYDWRVLEVQGSQSLLLSDKLLEKREYHKDLAAVTWERCTLRKYLNKDFYNKLPAEDRSRIAQRTIPNNDNPWFGTKGGNNTSDKIFLLSIEEAVKHLGYNNLARPKMSPEEKKFWCVDVFGNKNVSDWYNWYKQNGYPDLSFFIDFHGNPKRVAKDTGGSTLWWWLRSPGYYSLRAADIYYDGAVDIVGDGVNSAGGIRPALWLNL